jgi:hypothetical protein
MFLTIRGADSCACKEMPRASAGRSLWTRLAQPVWIASAIKRGMTFVSSGLDIQLFGTSWVGAVPNVRISIPTPESLWQVFGVRKSVRRYGYGQSGLGRPYSRKLSAFAQRLPRFVRRVARILQLRPDATTIIRVCTSTPCSERVVSNSVTMPPGPRQIPVGKDRR